MTDIKTNEKRRKVLKTAGVATVAAGAWHKPVLNSVITPAHAQTSEPVVMISGAGASSDIPVATFNKSNNNNLVDNAIEALVPSAHAGVTRDAPSGSLREICEAFTENNTHCVELMFPNGDDRNGEVMVSVTGPTIYYGYQCRYYDGVSSTNYYSYQGSFQINSSDTTTMTDGNFEVVLDGVTVLGDIDETFGNASGTMIYTGPTRSDSQFRFFSDSLGSYCDSYDGPSGAYWSAELGDPGGVCVIGSGPSGNIVVNTDQCFLQG